MVMAEDLESRFRKTLADSDLQAAVYAGTGLLMQKRRAVVSPDVLPDYQELRDHARALKEHALANLDHYLEQFEGNVRAHGGKVVWCRDGDDVASFLVDLAREKNNNGVNLGLYGRRGGARRQERYLAEKIIAFKVRDLGFFIAGPDGYGNLAGFNYAQFRRYLALEKYR